jgi:hypothetical protein
MELGAKLFSAARSKGEVLGRKGLFLLPGIAILGFLVWVLAEYFFMDYSFWGDVFEYGWEAWVAVGFVIVSLGYMLFILFILRFYTEVVVHEQGLALYYNGKEHRIPFTDLDGVTGYRIQRIYH